MLFEKWKFCKWCLSALPTSTFIYNQAPENKRKTIKQYVIRPSCDGLLLNSLQQNYINSGTLLKILTKLWFIQVTGKYGYLKVWSTACQKISIFLVSLNCNAIPAGSKRFSNPSQQLCCSTIKNLQHHSACWTMRLKWVAGT